MIATTAVSKAMRNGASAGKYDCGANNKINVKVIRAQNGMALSVDAALFHGPWGGLRIEDGFSIQSGEVKPRFADYEAIVPTMLA